MADPYNREEYIAKWSKLLGCKPDTWSVVVHLINQVKNYQTAMALLFGLSWHTDREYLLGVVEYFSKNFKAANGQQPVATAEWLYAFQQHYVTEVKKLPKKD